METLHFINVLISISHLMTCVCSEKHIRELLHCLTSIVLHKPVVYASCLMWTIDLAEQYDIQEETGDAADKP